ncbi:hypothetical protein [Actinospongicola halichondriae]|uniref:hypothetical protein n=1 Tax=Actinospongicola halichondriae TaxID=3236844 RepID=UPI003D469A76
MNSLDEIGRADGWRCWLCDAAVDPDMSVNDPRGPSIDSRTTRSKAKKKAKPVEPRLAHRGCNTGKGATEAVVPWADHLFVVDPVPIIPAVDRLSRKGGREIFARCPDEVDAKEAVEWLVDRVSRLDPDLTVTAEIEPGGGQYMIALRA